MCSEIRRFVRDLGADADLLEELTGLSGTSDELVGWMRKRGYGLGPADLPEVLSGLGEEVADHELDNVAGGTSDQEMLELQRAMTRRSQAFNAVSNIVKKFGSTPEGIIKNVV